MRNESFLSTIRRQSVERRRRITYGLTASIFAAIFAIWLGKISAGGIYLPNSVSSSQTPSPFAVVASSVESMKQGFSEEVSKAFGVDVKDTIESTSTVKEKIADIGKKLVESEVEYSEPINP